MAGSVLGLDPEELVFRGVRLHQEASQEIVLTNKLNAGLEIAIRPGSPDRYKVEPSSLELAPGESARVAVRLKLLRFANRRKGIEQGVRDAFHIRSKYFDQKFHATFFLDPMDPAADGPQPAQGGAARPSSIPRQKAPLRQSTPQRGRAGAGVGQERAYEAVFDDERETLPREPMQGAAVGAGKEAAWASQVADLRRQLQLKDAQIASVERRLELAQVMRGATRPAEPEEVRTQVAELQGALRQSRARARELEEEARALGEENGALRRFQDEMERANPDLHRAAEALLHRERAQQEARNRKVLEVLAAKDEAMSALEARNDELAREAATARSEMADLATKLDAAEARTGDLLRAKVDLEAQVERLGRDTAEAQAGLVGRVAELQGELEAARSRKAWAGRGDEEEQVSAARAVLEERTRELERALAEVEALRAGGAAASAASLGRAADAVGAHVAAGAPLAAEAASLRARVRELEEALQGNSVGERTSSELQARVVNLEAANKALEDRLGEVALGRMEALGGEGPAGLAKAVAQRDVAVAVLSARVAGLEAQLGAVGPAKGRGRDGRGRTHVDRIRELETKNAELEGHLGALRTQAEEKDGLLAAAAEELSRSGGEERGEAGWKAAHKLSERVTELSASEAALRTEVASLRALLGGGGRGEVLREANAGAREREKGKEEEDAIAGLHARLLEEMKERRAAEGRAKEAEREARMERERLEAEARRARVEGALRIKSLEETVQTLQGRDPLHGEVARLHAEVAMLRRAEARARDEARSEAALASSLAAEARALRAELAEATERNDEEEAMEAALEALQKRAVRDGVAAAVGDELRMVRQLQRDREADRVRHASEVARLRAALTEAEEKAREAAAAAAKAQGNAGEAQRQRRHDAPAAASGEAEAAARRARAWEREAEGLEEALEASAAEAASLKAEVAEANRALARAQSEAAESHRALHAAREQLAARAVDAAAQQSAELAALGQRCADAERKAATAEASQREREEEARALKLEVTRLRSEVESREAQGRALQGKAEATAEDARAKVAAARRERDAAVAQAEERRVQIAVLMETIEALQAGSPSERDQRIVTLTAQLAAARAVEGALERRAAELLSELEAAQGARARADEAAGRLGEELAAARAAAAGERANGETLKEELKKARAEVRQCEEESAGLARRLDAAQESLRRAQADLKGAQGALETGRARHMDQLWKEREERAEMLREAKDEAMRAMGILEAPEGREEATGAPWQDTWLAAALEELTNAIRSRLDERTGEEASPRTPASVMRAVERLKATAAEAERRRCRAEAEARWARGQAAGLASRLRSAESMLEQKTAQWEIAESARASEASSARAQARQAAQHMQERLDLVNQHCQRLQDALLEAQGRLVQAEADSAASKAAFEGERARAGSLERTVRVLEAAAREGEARMAALVVEHAGTPEAEAEEGVPAGVERRDLALKQYFEREVMRALIPSDPAAKVLALAREVCGLKLVESQLLASLRAAHKRADAAHARVAALGDALEEAHAQLDAAQRAAAPEEGGSAAAAAAAAAQLSARSADVHRAKEEALVLGQRLAASEARCQELERERARLEALAVKASGDAQAAVNRVREEMLAAHEAHLSELEAEARAARASAADALRQARAHAARAAAEAAEERERAVEEALAGRADPGEVKAAEAAREEAEKRAEGAERKAAEAAEEAEAFLRDLKEAQRECMELREEREANGRAISQLEEALRAVERAGAEGAGAGARRGRAGGRGDRGSGAAAELSRQLVQVRMSEADAQRRLRVAARAELELREQLRRRDARIEELKGMAGQRRDDGAGRRAGAASAPGSPRGERGRMGAGSRGAISRGRDGGGAGGGVEVASLKSELARREAQIEHLEVSLARAIAAGRDRDADMAELRKREDMVEEAHDAAQRHRRELMRLHDAIAASISTCKAVVSLSGLGDLPGAPRSPSGKGEGGVGDEWRTGEAIDALNALVQGLVQHAKEKDVSLRKAMARTKALEASLMGARTQAYAAPLEASQRAVIRDLTARCNQLAHEKAAMRADRDRLQERLSQLRASLGQGTGAARAAAAEGESQEGKGPRAPSLDVEAVLRRLEGDGDAAAEVARTKGARAPTAMGAAEQGHGARVYPEARELQGVVEVRGEEASEVLRQAQGMGELLAQHMGEMEAARGKVAAVAEALAGPGPIRGGEVGRLFVSEEQRRALVEGAGEMAAELQAMRSAVRVLLEDVGALGAMVGRAGERDEGEGEDPRVAAAVAAQREAEAEAEEAREDAEAARREAEGAREELEAARGESRRLQERCEGLHEEIRELTAKVARGEQDALGKLHEAERAAAEEAAGLRLEISKLEAALAGAEASKKELLTHAFQAGAFARAGEHSSTGDFAAMAARAAEAEARLAATERRAETEKAHWEGQVANLEARVKHLSDALDAQRSRPPAPAPARQEDGPERERTRAAEKRAEEAESKAASRKAQLRGLKTKFLDAREELRRQLAEALQRNEELVGQQRALRRALEDLGTRVDMAEAARAALEDQVRRHREEAACRKEEGAREAADAVVRMEARAEALGRECAALEARLGEQARESAAEAASRERAWEGRLQRAKAERRELEGKVREAEGAAEKARKEAAEARGQREDAERRAEEAERRAEEAAAQHEAYERELGERHAATIRSLEGRVAEERAALKREAEAAAALAEHRGKGAAELQVAEARARAAAAEAEASQRALRAEDQAAECARQLDRYRRFREQEVAALEAQLRQALGDTSTQRADGGEGREGRGKDDAWGSALEALEEMRRVLESDVVAAAVRQAELERLRREKAEEMAAAAGREASELKGRVKGLVKEQRQRGQAEAAGRAARGELEALRGRVEELEGQLAQSRKESSRRLRALRELQQQAEHGGEGAGVLAQVMAEREAREGVEARLSQARAECQRKETVAAGLRRRVEELEHAAQRYKEADWEGRCAALEARVKTLQAEVGRKQEMLQGLRQRMDGLVSAAEERGAVAEQGKAQSAVAKMRGEAARRGAQLEALKAQLAAAKEEAAGSRRAAEEAAKREATALRDASAEAASLRQRLSAVVDGIRGACRLLLRCLSVLAGGAARLVPVQDGLATQSPAPGAGLSARLPGRADGRAAAEAVADLLVQLEAAVVSPASSSGGIVMRAIDALLEGLERAVRRAEEASVLAHA